jgi:hypothetical protein
MTTRTKPEEGALSVWNRYYKIPMAVYYRVALLYGDCQAAGVEPTAIEDLPLGRKGGLIMRAASGSHEYQMTLDNGRIRLAVKDDIWDRGWRLLYQGNAAQPLHWRAMAEALRQKEDKAR